MAKTICIWLLILLASIVSLAQGSKRYKTGIDPANTVFKDVTLKQKVALSINGARFARDQMLDPDSFRVSRVWYRMFAVCMEFRSKNRMGGYDQGEGVYTDSPEEFSLRTPAPDSDSDSYSDYLNSNAFHANQNFKYWCLSENADKPVDVTDQVKAVLKADRDKE